MSPIYGTVGFQAPEVPSRRHVGRQRHLHGRAHAGRAGLRVQGLPEPLRRLAAVARRGADLRRARLAVPAAAEGAPRRSPRTGSRRPRRCALQLLGVLREVTAAAAGGAVTRSTPSTHLRDAQRVVAIGWTGTTCRGSCPTPTIPTASWLATSTADDPAQRRELLPQAPDVVGRRAPSPAATPRSSSAMSPAPRRPREQVLAGRPVGLARRVAAGSGRAAGRRQPRRGRRVQQRCTASCPASWRRSWRWPGRASWPASRRSPPGCTQCARGPTRPTSRRRSSAWPAWPSAAGRTTAALAALDQIPATSRAYGDSRRKRAQLLAAVPDERRTARRPRCRGARARPGDVDPAGTRCAADPDPRRGAATTCVATAPLPAAVIGGVERQRAGAAHAGSSRRTGRRPTRVRRPPNAVAAGRPGQPRSPADRRRDGVGDRLDTARRAAATDRRQATRSAKRAVHELDGRWRSVADGRRCRSATAAARRRRRWPTAARRATPSASDPGGADAGGRVLRSCGGPIARRRVLRVVRAKARSPRDHWTESPAPGSAGCATRASSHTRNEDAMALAATAEPSFAVLVVCDGVTSAPDSDRASLARVRRRRATLLTAAARPTGVVRGAADQLLADACWPRPARRPTPRPSASPTRWATRPSRRRARSSPRCVDDDLITVAWCGDSRAYWLPDDRRGSGN